MSQPCNADTPFTIIGGAENAISNYAYYSGSGTLSVTGDITLQINNSGEPCASGIDTPK